MSVLTLERLQEVLDYNPDTGLLTWKITNSRRRGAGAIAGSVDNNGYVVIRVDRKIYKAHRLAWLLMMEEWPKRTIDHINNIPADNRWCNLREATYSQNNANRGLAARNKSGFKGVVPSANGKRWIATVAIGGNKIRYLGTYDTPEEAHKVWQQAASARFGDFLKLK